MLNSRNSIYNHNEVNVLEELYFEVIHYGQIVHRSEIILLDKVIDNLFIEYDGFLFQVTRVNSNLITVTSLGEVDE